MSYYKNSYSAGDTFIDYSGNKYTVVTGGNTPSTPFDSSNIVNDKIVWGDLELELVTGGGGQGLVDYAPNTSYNVGDTVIYDDKIYRCIIAHTSTATFDDTKWEELSPSDKGLYIWQANTAYNIDDIVIDSNLIWKCVVSHTSTTTFDESKWVCISGGEISNGLEIVDLWEGSYNGTGASTAQELSDSVFNYDKLLITFDGKSTSTDNNKQTFICNTSDVTAFNRDTFRLSVFANSSSWTSVAILFSDSTHFYGGYYGTTSWSAPYITKIQGIRKAPTIVSSGMKYETLYEGEAGSISGSVSDVSIQLSDAYTKFQKIGITVNFDGTSVSERYFEFNTSDIKTSSNIMIPYGLGSSDYRVGGFKALDSLTLTAGMYNHAVITKIIGISEGVVVPTGVQAARVILFEGSIGNSSGGSIISVELSDEYNNYDVLGFYSTVYYRSDSIKYIYREVQASHITDMISSGNPSYEVAMNWGWSSFDDYVSINKDSTADNLSIYVNKTIITKIVGIKYIQPDSYSTEEKLIGTWIDGKPLYQKTYTGTVGATNTNVDLVTDSAITTMENAFIKDGYFRSSTMSGDVNDSYVSNEQTRVWISFSDGSIRANIGSYYASCPFAITLNYTKTTD